jgi:hypothetical protein
MHVIQCDYCKKIIDTGERVRLEHGKFQPKDEEIKYLKLSTREFDLCNDCYLRLLEFFGLKKE